MANEYHDPSVLASTEWVAQHLNDPDVRIVESDEDILLYDIGHIPGAVKMDWHTDLQDRVRRDFIDKLEFEALMGKAGISNEKTVEIQSGLSEGDQVILNVDVLQGGENKGKEADSTNPRPEGKSEGGKPEGGGNKQGGSGGK